MEIAYNRLFGAWYKYCLGGAIQPLFDLELVSQVTREVIFPRDLELPKVHGLNLVSIVQTRLARMPGWRPSPGCPLVVRIEAQKRLHSEQSLNLLAHKILG
ncbi:MAG: hypothetical protein LBE38_00350 [Deltaproteobacteria bacterium]|jgi:hypothetical protein|nr:hypothetical protein [Deltaproteobacteria bacterium]